MSVKLKKLCPFCHVKPVRYTDGCINRPESGILLAGNGCYSQLYIGTDDVGPAMWAAGDDYTESYHPKFCPECGRKLEVSE